MSGSSAGDYFDEGMVNRSRLLWTVATRRQLERWEPFVAAHVFALYGRRHLSHVDIWAAELEHHFAMVAARNLIRALELEPRSTVALDPTIRAELIEGRDLLEHWVDNLPVFNVSPRQREPRHRSGREFAARNPDNGPYWWLDWNGKEGAKLMPHVSAHAVHDVLDAVEAEVLADGRPELASFVPPRAPSPWIRERGQWWPKGEASGAEP
ncbi:MAG TPA: hypothetical protein VGO31_14695 [Microbacteriaceae bacterium]|jgi:hypothetical protein|nr:hypothetical protein [Microbacteriaceae bacterium]